MSMRLQVVMDEAEYSEIQEFARSRELTVSEWVRETLRTARENARAGDPAEKLAAIKEASKYSFPVGDPEEMKADILRGYDL